MSISHCRSWINSANFLKVGFPKIVPADPTRINFFLALVKATFSRCQSVNSSPTFPVRLERTREIITKSESFPWNLSIVETVRSLNSGKFKYFNCGRYGEIRLICVSLIPSERTVFTINLMISASPSLWNEFPFTTSCAKVCVLEILSVFKNATLQLLE